MRAAAAVTDAASAGATEKTRAGERLRQRGGFKPRRPGQLKPPFLGRLAQLEPLLKREGVTLHRNRLLFGAPNTGVNELSPVTGFTWAARAQPTAPEAGALPQIAASFG